MQCTAGLDINQPHVVIYSTHIQNIYIYIYFPYFPHMLVVILNFAGVDFHLLPTQIYYCNSIHATRRNKLFYLAFH